MLIIEMPEVIRFFSIVCKMSCCSKKLYIALKKVITCKNIAVIDPSLFSPFMLFSSHKTNKKNQCAGK